MQRVPEGRVVIMARGETRLRYRNAYGAVWITLEKDEPTIVSADAAAQLRERPDIEVLEGAVQGVYPRLHRAA